MFLICIEVQLGPILVEQTIMTCLSIRDGSWKFKSNHMTDAQESMDIPLVQVAGFCLPSESLKHDSSSSFSRPGFP